MAQSKLTHRPDPETRGPKGRGHEMPGMGKHPGSKVHGGHSNVVNEKTHAEKLKHC